MAAENGGFGSQLLTSLENLGNTILGNQGLVAGIGNAILPGNPFGGPMGGTPTQMIAAPLAPVVVAAGGAVGRAAAGAAARRAAAGAAARTVATGAAGAGLAELAQLALDDGMGGGNIGSPFRMTAAGNQVAQPFVTQRANGSMEWFIPAGKPTAWSKASVKRRRCRPR